MEKESYALLNEIESRHWWFVVRREILIRIYYRFFPKNSSQGNENILDIGCGNGGNLDCLKQLGNVTGVEYEESAVTNFKLSHPDSVVYQGYLPDGMPAEISNRKFSMVTMLDVLEHIEEEQESVQKVMDLLQPGGKLLLTVPAYNWLWTPGDDLAWHKRRYTRKRLKDLTKGMGFKVVYCSYFNTILFPLEAMVRILSRLIKNYDSRTELSVSSINPILAAIFRLEKLLIPAVSLPFGLSIVVLAVKK